MSSNKRREQQSRTVSLDDFHFESLAYVKKMTRAPESQSIGILPVLIFDLPPSTKQFVIINPTESIETKEDRDWLFQVEMPSILRQHDLPEPFSLMLQVFAKRSLVQPDAVGEGNVEVLLVQSSDSTSQMASAALLLSSPLEAHFRLSHWNHDPPVDPRFAQIWGYAILPPEPGFDK